MDYTATVIGDDVNQDHELILLEDDNTAPAPGKFKLWLGHLAPFASDLGDTIADVCTDDGTPILEGGKFGDVAPYDELAADTYDLKITTPGCDTILIDLALVTFEDGQIVSAFVVVNGTIQPLGGFALPAGVEGFFLRLKYIYLFPLFLN